MTLGTNVAVIKTQPGEEIQQSLSAAPEDYTTSNSTTSANTFYCALEVT
jgi:hypothetical protein